MAEEVSRMPVSERECRGCGRTNDLWPYGLCSECKVKEDARDAAYEQAIRQQAADIWRLRYGGRNAR
jgi:hypothetical protein